TATAKIVGGVPADWGQLPFVVALESPRGQQLCGAAILNERWLATAAHSHQIVAIAGSLDPSSSASSSNASNRQVSEGAEVRLAPGYAQGTQLDLALIRLKRPFKWRNGIVEPVCLPKDRAAMDQLGTVAGWGWNDEEGVNMSNKLHRVQVPLMSRAECEKRFLAAGYAIPIDKTKICAGWPQGGQDACQGDSGGPLVVSQDGVFVLTGVVSGGIGCARPGLPGLYTNVAHFLPWILDIIKKRK
ncbi:hypothetical protein DAPPUDRAFT_60449, partial [Daphnia pulex]